MIIIVRLPLLPGRQDTLELRDELVRVAHFTGESPARRSDSPVQDDAVEVVENRNGSLHRSEHLFYFSFASFACHVSWQSTELADGAEWGVAHHQSSLEEVERPSRKVTPSR